LRGGEEMEVYAILVTIIAVSAIIIAMKWKISMLAITYFCIDKFRKPTDEEIADYTKKAVSKMFKG
jgi:hypothetical protein